jgi:hypothetical protein
VLSFARSPGSFPACALTAGFCQQLLVLTGTAHRGDHLLVGPVRQLQKKSPFVLQIKFALLPTRAAAVILT